MHAPLPSHPSHRWLVGRAFRLCAFPPPFHWWLACHVSHPQLSRSWGSVCGAPAPFSPVVGRHALRPTRDRRVTSQKGTFILTSLLEDLGYHTHHPTTKHANQDKEAAVLRPSGQPAWALARGRCRSFGESCMSPQTSPSPTSCMKDLCSPAAEASRV